MNVKLTLNSIGCKASKIVLILAYTLHDFQCFQEQC